MWPARLLTLVPLWVALALPFVLLARIPLTRFATERFQLAALLLIAVALFALGWPLAELIRSRLHEKLAARLPRRGDPDRDKRTRLWLLGLFGPAFAVIAMVYALADIPTALGWRPLILIAAASLGQLLAVSWLGARSLPRASPVALVLAPLVGGALMALPMSHTQTRSGIMSHGLLVPTPIRALWKALDGDGDGFASAFGGGDCDDGDPSVHPLATDIVGNGVDEDCSGRDARSLSHPHEAAPMTPTPWPLDKARPRHLILITVEALRHDAISPRTPNLLELEEGAWRFARAHSAGPATHLSLSGLMTGRYPSRIAWDLKARPPQIKALPVTLPQALRERGWLTDAFVTQWVHRHVSPLKRDFGAFEKASEKGGSSQALLTRALAHLDGLDPARSHFIWVHFVEPHWPHESGRTETLDSGYQAELITVDSRIGQLLDALRGRPDWSDTVVVLTGDHGEALGAHGVQTHGVTLYDAEVRVPLLIRVPGSPGGDVEAPVSLVDVAPTALDLIGWRGPTPFDGRSLAPAMLQGEALGPRPVFAESYNPLSPPEIWLSVYWGRWKLLRRRHEGRDELFDVIADPGELDDLSATGPDILESLKAEATRFGGGGKW